MTPLEYARICAARYPNRDVKGRGHAPRVRVDHRHPFQKLLPKQKITHRNEADSSISARWYAAQSNWNAYSDDLLAAGLDLITGEIISKPHWLAAQVVVRLTGEPYGHMATLSLAAEVRALIEERHDRELGQALRDHQL